jgi:hypothetical protein
MNPARRCLFLFVLACVSILGPVCVPAAAQQITGAIPGTVTDPSEAVLLGATVTATQVQTGFTRSASRQLRGQLCADESAGIEPVRGVRVSAFPASARMSSAIRSPPVLSLRIWAAWRPPKRPPERSATSAAMQFRVPAIPTETSRP